MMNGNLAAYSGHSYMPHTVDKSNLRLDLNLMNLNKTNGSTPCTPNGKIKVYMNNITSNVTKIKNASNECKEWKRCKLDNHNCISLESVLETFNSSISEEQAWAICFGFVNCIKKLTRTKFKFKDLNSKNLTNNNLNEEHFILYLHKDGFVHEKTIFQHLINQSESNNLNYSSKFSRIDGNNELDDGLNDDLNNYLNGYLNDELDLNKNGLMNDVLAYELNEQELLMRLGLALFDALDYKQDIDEELFISPELENLIAKITLEEPDGNIAFTIDEIYDICCSRKASQDEGKIDEYYSNICKTLVIETMELSTFLQTIYEGTQMREKMFNNNLDKQDCTDSLNPKTKLGNDEPLKLHLAQWAKLWMQVLDEFRNGKRKLRKVETKNTSNSSTISHLDHLNAHALIMEYIRSRPALMPANNRKLGPLKPSPQSLIEQIHEAIRKQDVKLKPVHLNSRNNLFAPVVGRVLDNSNEEKNISNSENNSHIIRRKLIKADIDSFIDWDDEFRVRKYSSLF